MKEALAAPARRLLQAAGPLLPGRRSPRLGRQQLPRRVEEIAIEDDRVDLAVDHRVPELGIVQGGEIAAHGLPERRAAVGAERGEPRAHRLIGQLMDQPGIERLELVLVEPRRRPRHMGKVEALQQPFIGGDRVNRLRGPDQRRNARHRHRLDPLLAHAGDRQRAEPFRQPLAIGPDQQAVMGELRRLGRERLEQLDLHRGVDDMVLAADDVGDFEIDVVDDRWQRVEIAAVARG